ncbi:MAG: polymer-forming cytoskeletal protein [Alphaproteobacteria bacterium]|nr:polymer-forming cytoskeletal protein [Alphaproteobacteria bacterium]
MFGSKERPGAPQAVVEGPVARSHIAAGMSVTGDIEGDIDLLLDGKLEGNLRCRSVTIGRSGELVGKIQAQEAVIDGRVEGDIEAKIVKLNVTATMIGDVRHDVIEVAAGAKIEGRYSRIDGKSGAKPVVKSSHKTDKADAPPKAPAAIAPVEDNVAAVAEKPAAEVVAMGGVKPV